MHYALEKMCKIVDKADLEMKEQEAKLHLMEADTETNPDKVIQFYIDNVRRLDVKLTRMLRLLSYMALLFGEIDELYDYYDRPAPVEK